VTNFLIDLQPAVSGAAGGDGIHADTRPKTSNRRLSVPNSVASGESASPNEATPPSSSLTDPDAVFATAQNRRPDRVTNVTAARARAVVDAESGTVETLTDRFDAAVRAGEPETAIGARVRCTFAVGVGVRPPDVLGPRSVGEWP